MQLTVSVPNICIWHATEDYSPYKVKRIGCGVHCIISIHTYVGCVCFANVIFKVLRHVIGQVRHIIIVYRFPVVDFVEF